LQLRRLTEKKGYLGFFVEVPFFCFVFPLNFDEKSLHTREKKVELVNRVSREKKGNSDSS